MTEEIGAQWPLARTSHEALLYLDLTPCSCGGRRFETSSVQLELTGGSPTRRYSRICQACGTRQDFSFRLPAEPLSSSTFAYGGSRPSELIDAAQWLWVADFYARAVPPAPERLPDAELRKARGRLEAAVAAIDEILKFIPAGSDIVPAAAVWTSMGEGVLATDGERLRAGRLGAVRSAYARILGGLA